MGNPPAVLYDSSASGMRFRGEVSSLLDPSVLIADREVQVTQTHRERCLRGENPSSDDFEIRLSFQFGGGTK
eukprot:15474539-Heterocapsa_arctica.AAC.1